MITKIIKKISGWWEDEEDIASIYKKNMRKYHKTMSEACPGRTTTKMNPKYSHHTCSGVLYECQKPMLAGMCETHQIDKCVNCGFGVKVIESPGFDKEYLDDCAKFRKELSKK